MPYRKPQKKAVNVRGTCKSMAIQGVGLSLNTYLAGDFIRFVPEINYLSVFEPQN